MLTILSNADLEQIRSHLASITALLEHAQTIHVDGNAPAKSKSAVALPELPQAESQTGTHKSRRKVRHQLTERKVAEIKRLLQEKTMTAAAIARQYKVHLTTVYSIKYGKTWQHVAPLSAKPSLEIVEIRK